MTVWLIFRLIYSKYVVLSCVLVVVEEMVEDSGMKRHKENLEKFLRNGPFEDLTKSKYKNI